MIFYNRNFHKLRLLSSQGSVETLLMLDGKRLNYFVDNLFNTPCSIVTTESSSDWVIHDG